MTLKEFQKMSGTKRIDFQNVKPVDLEKQFASDVLICPYCKHKNEYGFEEIDSIISGTKYLCSNCEKWFYAEGEVSINTCCTPIENKVLEAFTRNHIQDTYNHMDICLEGGVNFVSKNGVAEYIVFDEYAKPLFENMDINKKDF